MTNNKINQNQIKKTYNYDDTLVSGASLQSLAISLEDDLNAIRAQLNKIIGKNNWYDDPDTNLNELQTSGINIWSVIGTDSGSVRPAKEQDVLYLLGSGGIRTYITENPGEEDTVYIESTRNMFTSIEADSGSAITASSPTDNFSIIGGAGIDVLATQSGFSFSYSGVNPQHLWFRIETNDGLATVANTTQDTLRFAGGWGISTRIDAPDTVVYISDIFDGTNSVSWENLKLTGISPNSIIFLNSEKCFAGNKNFVYNSSTKSIGIGTDFPTESLHVRGTLLKTLTDLSDSPTIVTQDSDSNSVSFVPSSGKEFVSHSNGLIVASNATGMSVYKLVEDDEKLNLVKNITNADVALSRAGQIVGHHVYSALSKLVMYDIRTPEPSLIFSETVNGIARSLFVNGGYVYLGQTSAISSYYIGNEGGTVLLDSIVSYSGVGVFEKIDFYKNTLFAISVGTENRFVSLTSSPEISKRDEILNYDANFDPRDMAFYGDYAYIVSFAGEKLYVVDISDVDNMQVVNVITTTPALDSPSRIDILGRHMLITNSSDIRIFDLDSNPTNPVYIGKGTHAGVVYNGRGFLNNNRLYLADTTSNGLSITSLKGFDVVAANIGSLSSDHISLDGELNVSHRMSAGTLNCTGQSINVYSDFGVSFKKYSKVIGGVNIGSFEDPSEVVVLDGASMWCGVRKNPVGTSREILAVDLEEPNSDYSDILSLNSFGNILFVTRDYDPTLSVTETLHLFRQTGWTPAIEQVSDKKEGKTGLLGKIKVVGNKFYRPFNLEINVPLDVSLVSAVLSMNVYDISNISSEVTETQQFGSSSLAAFEVVDGVQTEFLSDFDVQGDLAAFVTTKGRIILSKIEKYEDDLVSFYTVCDYTEDSSHIFIGVQLDGNYVYVTSSNGFRWAKYDISDISSPVLVGSLSFATVSEEGQTYGVVRGGYLHFVDNIGYHVYSVRENVGIKDFSENLIGTYGIDNDFKKPFKILLKGNYSFVLCGYGETYEEENSKVVIFDIKDSVSSAPVMFEEITFSENSEFPIDFSIVNNSLYVGFSQTQKVYGYDLGHITSGGADIGYITAYDLHCTQQAIFYKSSSIWGNIETQNGNVVTSGGLTAKKYSGQQFGIANMTQTNAGYIQSDTSLVVSGYSGGSTFFASSSVFSDTKITRSFTYQTLDYYSDANASRYWHIQSGGIYEITISGGIIITDLTSDVVTLTIIKNNSDFDPANADVVFEKTFNSINQDESPRYHSVTYKGRIESDTYVTAFIQGSNDTVYFEEGSQFTIVKVG